MDKDTFVEELIKSLIYHFNSIKESAQLISYGIYTDGGASTIGVYYNTVEKLEKDLKLVQTEYTGNKFSYEKDFASGYFNQASYIMSYEKMRIMEVK